MKREAHTHPKVLEFIDWVDEQIGDSLRQIGIGAKALAKGMLDDLWNLAHEHAPQGDIGKFANKRIARTMAWFRDPDELIEVLIECRLVDRHDEHRLIIHDWPEHCGDFVHSRLARNGLRFADGSIPKMTRLKAEERRRVAEQGYYLEPPETLNERENAPDERPAGAAPRGTAQKRAQPLGEGAGREPGGSLAKPGGRATRAHASPEPVPQSPPAHPPSDSKSKSPPDQTASVAEFALGILEAHSRRPQWLADPASVIVARDSIAAAVARHGDGAVRQVISLGLTSKSPPEAVAEIRDSLLRWPNALTPKSGRDRVEIALEALAITNGSSSSSDVKDPGGYPITKGDLEILWWDGVVVRTRCQGRADFKAGDDAPAEGAQCWDALFRRVGRETGVRALAAALYRIPDDPELAQRFAKDPRVIAEPGVMETLLGTARVAESEKRISSPSGGLSASPTPQEPALA
jgi:hypothetical protein